MNNDLYFSFDNFNLNDVFIVTNIEKKLLPGKSYQTIDIPTIDGERLNGVKYTPLVYTISLLIEGEDIENRNYLKSVLRDLLKTKKEVRVAFNKNKHGYGMVTSEVSMEDRNSTQTTAQFELTCFIPFFYGNTVKAFDDNNNVITVINDGGEPVKPFMTIGFTKDTHFCQIENRRTGEKILIGNYPSLNTTNTFKEKEVVVYSDCTSTNGWSQSSASIDSDRTVGGTISLASNGNGLILGSLPSGTTLWKGASYRLNLTETAEEFTVSANFDFKSTGVNGDPSQRTYKLDEQVITSGTKVTYYKVTASALNVRTGPGTTYKSLGTVAQGFEIYNGTVVNGWLKFKYTDKYGNQDCYCSCKYLQTMVKDNTTTTTLQNWVVTLKSGAALCSSARFGINNDYSTQICRIPVGEVVRLNVSTEYRENYKGADGKDYHRIWYKLHTPYKGKTGYICRKDCTRADQKITINYAEDEILQTADDKTGLIELYGFDSSGSKLFSMVLADWNKYYECTIPRCEVGQKTILGTNGQEVPGPKQVFNKDVSDGSTTINYKYILSGKYGDWNDMWCKFTVTRRKVNGKYVWASNIQRIDNGVVTKTMSVSNKSDTSFPTGQLSYLVLYIGTSGDMSKCCDMALTDVIAYKYNTPSSTSQKATYFQQGDILDIDFDNRQVYINEQPANYLLDIGSRFFDIDTGITDVKINSDDGSAVSSLVIREKWVGDN